VFIGHVQHAGSAYSFFTSANGRMAKQLVNILEEAQQAVPPELRQYAMTSGGPSSEWAGAAVAHT
jgi:ATP-dependent RNA helicase DDX5/DBP2